MSVHGEYSRSLEWMMDALRASDRSERARWIAALEAARVEAQPDLTSAARIGLEVARSIETTLGDAADASPATVGLRERCEHLSAHCRIVLGL